MARTGHNFRQDGFSVTDGAGEIAIIETVANAADAHIYPNGPGGYGYASLTGWDKRNRDAAVNPRIAGMHFATGSGLLEWRRDLPDGPGTYRFWILLGDKNGGVGWPHRVRIRDGSGGTILHTVTGTTSIDRWIDTGYATNNAQRTAADIAAGTYDYVEVTMTGSTVALEIGDGSGNVNSTIAHFAFEKQAGPPALINPTQVVTGPTQATIGVRTDTLPATTAISYVVLPAADAVPSAATIVASPTGTITTGAINTALTVGLTGLTTDTAYRVHFAQGASSNVASTASFTPSTLAIAGTALSAQNGNQGAAFTWTGVTPESLVTNIGNGSGAWVASGLGASGLTVNASTGVLQGTSGTVGTYNITLTRYDGSTVGGSGTGGRQEVTKSVTVTIADGTNPTLTGTITVTNLTATTYTLTWPTASDNVAVAGYDYSLDGGTNWTSQVGTTVNVTGRTSGATDQVRVRARDSVPNYSTPLLSTAVTLLTATTGVTMTGPTSGTAGVASTNFTVGITPVSSYFAGTLVVTPSDAADGGTFTPSSLNLTLGSPSGTFTYTAATGGTKTLSVTNNGGFSNPSNISFVAATPDTTNPTLVGTITVTNLTHNSYTLTWPLGSDNVAVAGYDYSLNGGTSYVSLGNVLTVNITGRTPSAVDQVRVRARDTSGNLSTPVLSAAVTLNPPPDVTLPVLTGTITITNLTHNSYTAAWSNATDNIGVTGYEYSLNGGSTWTSVGLVTVTNITGRTPSSADAFMLRAFDFAGNRSTPALSTTVNLLTTPTLTSSPLRNGSNMLHLSAPFTAYVYDPTSGVRILTKTNLVSHATTGVVTFQDNALNRIPYRVSWKRTDLGTYGLETLTPT